MKHEFRLAFKNFFSDYQAILSPNEQLLHLTRMNASKVRVMKASLFEMEVADDGMFIIFSQLFSGITWRLWARVSTQRIRIFQIPPIAKQVIPSMHCSFAPCIFIST